MTGRTVTGPEAADVRAARKASPDTATARLIAGDLVHYDDTRAHFSRHRLRTLHGLRLRTRLDGFGGQYFWAEPRDTQDGTA